jgi:hypothetical protein
MGRGRTSNLGRCSALVAVRKPKANNPLSPKKGCGQQLDRRTRQCVGPDQNRQTHGFSTAVADSAKCVGAPQAYGERQRMGRCPRFLLASVRRNVECATTSSRRQPSQSASARWTNPVLRHSHTSRAFDNGEPYLKSNRLRRQAFKLIYKNGAADRALHLIRGEARILLRAHDVFFVSSILRRRP